MLPYPGNATRHGSQPGKTRYAESSCNWPASFHKQGKLLSAREIFKTRIKRMDGRSKVTDEGFRGRRRRSVFDEAEEPDAQIKRPSLVARKLWGKKKKDICGVRRSNSVATLSSAAAKPGTAEKPRQMTLNARIAAPARALAHEHELGDLARGQRARQGVGLLRAPRAYGPYTLVDALTARHARGAANRRKDRATSSTAGRLGQRAH